MNNHFINISIIMLCKLLNIIHSPDNQVQFPVTWIFDKYYYVIYNVGKIKSNFLNDLKTQ